MTQLSLDQLNPILVNQLETLAQLHGCSLQEEIEYILQQAVQNQLCAGSTGSSMAAARAAVERAKFAMQHNLLAI